MCSLASALRHAHRARCLAHHTMSTPEPQGEPVAPRAAAAALVHTTRTPPAQPHTTFVCCAGQHVCPSTKLCGAVLHAAAPLGTEATSPRASEALSSRPGCSIDGRAAAAAGGCGGAPVSCGYATEAALGRLLEAAELTAAQVQSILH